MKNFLLLFAAGIILAAGGCAPRDADTASPDAAGGAAVDPAAPVDPTAEAEATAREADAARIAGFNQDCLRRRTGSAPQAEAPPTTTGLYEARCTTCSRRWLRIKQEIPLRSAPSDAAPQTAILPAETWVYALEETEFLAPLQGVVVEPGSGYGLELCDIVYRVGIEPDEGTEIYSVWRRGRIFRLSYGGEEPLADDAARPEIYWQSPGEQTPSPADAEARRGKWLRLEGRGGEAGWFRDGASETFECYWERDPEDICETAPQGPPPRR